LATVAFEVLVVLVLLASAAVAQVRARTRAVKTDVMVRFILISFGLRGTLSSPKMECGERAMEPSSRSERCQAKAVARCAS
jgi:hypothetical protein